MQIDPKELERSMVDHPAQTVAMVAVQAIGELSGMMDKAGIHDEASTGLVIGLCAWLTSVLDGKDALPGLALVDAAKTLDRATLDELSRCQHFVQDLHERTKKAESVALVNEQYAKWYLRLRDQQKSVEIFVETGDPDRYGPSENGHDFDVDALMEDMDSVDHGNDIDKPE